MSAKKGRPATGRPSAKIATTPGVLFDVQPTADARQATPAQVHVEVGRVSAWVHGPVAAAVKKLGTRAMWCRYYRCLTVPVDELDDLLAHLEYRCRQRVTVEAVNR